jgi:hypothetical protein
LWLWNEKEQERSGRGKQCDHRRWHVTIVGDMKPCGQKRKSLQS